MDITQIMKELESYGDENVKRIYLNHGAKEPIFGVRVQDMKKIVKKIKKDHELSLQLYHTGNSDAMYLAGLIADEKQITKNNLREWVKAASYYWVSEYTVPWVAAETDYGFELGLEWIESDIDSIASAGWSTLASTAAVNPDSELDIETYSKLLDRVAQNIGNGQNRERYTMNGFVIAVGSYIVSLTEKAMETAEKIGNITVDMGGTACKVPLATAYIKKVADRGSLGKKRKTARC